MQAVETKIRKNRKITITTLSLEFPDVSRSVVYKIVTDFKNFVLGGYPDSRTRRHKEKRFAISLDFLLRYEEEGDDMLSIIDIGDETWRNSVLGPFAGGPQGTTINCEPLRKFQRAFQNRHDVKKCFASPRYLLHRLGSQSNLLDHAPYNPDLAPSDFHLFRYLKHGAKRFSDNEEVKAAVNSWLSDQAVDFFEEGFQNLVLWSFIQLICDESVRNLSTNILRRLFGNYKLAYISNQLREANRICKVDKVFNKTGTPTFNCNLCDGTPDNSKGFQELHGIARSVIG
ncbi:histone-lysine N-methyltransferase SETMAR [Trichonephila clavipes]|uniref:Histone-lysine N-methyltransferase SETMAR n=1 Tax=Trichonephila clavipes TaxID=2585209 RepID=A0A8X6RH72_TRICX|nr:histone-lysine N-methyltransferase SETMAR [Trichonephila clavipes]